MVQSSLCNSKEKDLTMIVVLKSMSGAVLSLLKIGGIREFVRYASENRQLLFGIAGTLVLISILCSEEQNRKLLFLYSFVIVYLTLLNRNTIGRKFMLTPFWSYRRFFEGEYFRSMIINNILLFIPLGTILSRLKPEWSTARTLVMISVGIEFLQYLSGRGVFETDDIISNSLGGLIGLAVGLLRMYTVRFFKKLKG